MCEDLRHVIEPRRKYRADTSDYFCTRCFAGSASVLADYETTGFRVAVRDGDRITLEPLPPGRALRGTYSPDL